MFKDCDMGQKSVKARAESAGPASPGLLDGWQGWMASMRARVSPGRIDHPFRVVGQEVTSVTVGEGRDSEQTAVFQYELNVPYQSMSRASKVGKARLFVAPDAGAPMPLIVAMHYEMSLDGAAEYLAQGWAVMTPREALNPFGDGINFNLALLHASRQMPFVDAGRIGLVGASAGGYVTLMVASEAFPVAAAAALAPIVSVPYEVGYFANNIEAANCGAKDDKGKDASRVPVFCLVAEAVKGFASFLGPLQSAWRAWLQNSPVGVMSLVTCPVVATFSTADVLVPINQVSERFVVPPARDAFPEGFEFAPRALVAVPRARTTFMQAARGRGRVFQLNVPDGAIPSWEAPEPGNVPAAHEIQCVFSKQRALSIVILDEGAPDPRVGHFKYRFRYSLVPFFKHWFGRRAPLAPEQLTLRKLELLMRRFRGEDFEALTSNDKAGKQQRLLTRRNGPDRERADVIAGLRAYCESGPAHRQRLAALYRRLPRPLRALDVGGARLDADVSGGLAYHEAVLQYRCGDRARACLLAQRLLRGPRHGAYARHLPARLVRMAQTGAPAK